MRILLDTHTLIWWLADNPALSAKAHNLIEETDNTILVSAVSVWEMAIKFQSGKLPSVAHLLSDFSGHLQREQFEPLLITVDHSIRAGLLPGLHKDPFDRMLIAQSQAENIPIISNDAAFDQYGVRRIW